MGKKEAITFSNVIFSKKGLSFHLCPQKLGNLELKEWIRRACSAPCDISLAESRSTSVELSKSEMVYPRGISISDDLSLKKKDLGTLEGGLIKTYVSDLVLFVTALNFSVTIGKWFKTNNSCSQMSFGTRKPNLLCRKFEI